VPHGVFPVTLLSEGSESMTVGKQKRDFMEVARGIVEQAIGKITLAKNK
jgi:hypothetical protein